MNPTWFQWLIIWATVLVAAHFLAGLLGCGARWNRGATGAGPGFFEVSRNLAQFSAVWVPAGAAPPPSSNASAVFLAHAFGPRNQ
jgi:hypothetical protein